MDLLEDLKMSLNLKYIEKYKIKYFQLCQDLHNL